MRFMMMIKSDEKAGPPSAELVAAIGQLGAEMAKAGVLLEMGGLFPSAAGAKLRLSGGKVTVNDGPFTETKELVGGYAILAAKSKEEAIEYGRRFLNVHAEILGNSYEGELEIRQMSEGRP